MAAPAVPSAVAAWLERWSLPDAHVVTLTGDASDRRYVRVMRPGAAPCVLAIYAEPFDIGTLPFANVTRLFDAAGVRVPRILGHADDLGILVLEDLGDVTLQAHLGVASPDRHRALYQQAVGIIATMQEQGRGLANLDYLPFGVAFDDAKLMWELDYFLKHFVGAYRGVTLSPADHDGVRAECEALAGDLAAEPRVLCHRDYHSRNLMLHADELVVIDYQDARMGPDTYDLVSLLRDAYVDLPDDEVDALIAHFLSLRPGAADAGRFRERFDTMAVQRTLKALGTFGYQASVRGNPVYIQYIPRTLSVARQAMRSQRRFERLAGLLATHVPELR